MRLRQSEAFHLNRSAAARLLCALLLVLVLAAASFAKPAEPQTIVKAGYFYNGDFMHKAADGSYAGYDIELYYTIAGYAGWKVQFVEFDGLKPALEALENGSIDVLSGLSKTPERDSKYLISSMKMCTAHIAVQTRADDDRFAPGDTATMKDLTCGILRASNVVALYSDWCRSNGLTPHIVEFDTLKLRNAALADKKVEALAGGSTIAGAKKIAEFSGLDLYFMFNRDKPLLKSQLDRAMSILSLEDPAYDDNLFIKYFPASRNRRPFFAAAEKAFLAAHPVVKVALLENDAPFSSKNADGSFKGILPRYYEHLAKVTGTDFQCVPCASKKEACALLAAGEVDLAGKFEDDIFDANDSHVLLTVPYLRTNLVQITRAGTSNVSHAAVPECNSRMVAATLARSDLSLKTKLYGNSEACFSALKSGAADSVVCTQLAASWLLNRNRTSDYTVLAFGSDAFAVTCATSLGADGNMLRSILNKTIAVDDGFIHQLITSYTLKDSADLAGYVESLPISLITGLAVAAAALLVLTVMALIVILRRRSIEKKLAAQAAALAAVAEANKTRHAFFGSVSHDMRTPLNGIVGFTHLALQSGDQDQIRDYLTKIQASGAVLTGLVNDMLVMSRMESGKYVLKPSPSDTDEIFRGIVEPVRVLAQEKGVVFEENTSALRRRRVMADKLSLQKIFLNLLSNAIKFTPRGGKVTLDCRLEQTGSEPPESVLVVADSGRGISRKFLPHVFEPFAQENATNADTSGSGLGLSIVRSIVDAMGGSIEVESEQGKGTRFTVRLRLEEAREPAAPAAAKPAGAGVLRGKRALVCEDNELNLEIVKSILEQQGMEVTGAANGQLGVEAFKNSGPGWFAAVLLDLRMPVLDGRSAAAAIRALDRADAQTVPIFAVSADAFGEDVKDCLKAGMNAHIAKPVDAEALVDTLARFVK